MPTRVSISQRIIVDVSIPIQPLNDGRDNRIRLGEESNGGARPDRFDKTCQVSITRRAGDGVLMVHPDEIKGGRRARDGRNKVKSIPIIAVKV